MALHAVLYLLLPYVIFHLLWRARRQPEYLQHWGERFGRYATRSMRPVIWLHTVSVGETRAAAPLIKALQASYPEHQILLTHMTPTGREAGEQLFGDRCAALLSALRLSLRGEAFPCPFQAATRLAAGNRNLAQPGSGLP